MTNEKYNGWTNYATWRVALEWFDGDNEEYYGINASDMADMLKDNVESYLEETSTGVAFDYALAFLSDVNWYEIAQHIADDLNESEN